MSPFVFWFALALGGIAGGTAFAQAPDPGQGPVAPPEGTPSAPPETAATESAARIAECLRLLDDDSFEKRDAATKELAAMGEPAFAPLQEFLKGAPSLEAKTRAEQALQEIERVVRFKGGETVHGLQAMLRCSKPESVEGEPVSFELEIRNVGTEPREIVPIIELEQRREGRSGFRINRRTAQARVVVRQTEGAQAPPVGIQIVGMGREKGAPRKIALQPGESRTGPIFPAGGGHFPAGSYEVELLYYAQSRGLVAGAEKDLEANKVRLVIRPRPEVPTEGRPPDEGEGAAPPPATPPPPPESGAP